MKIPIKKVKESRFLKSPFLGKQLSRLKMGQSYAAILLSAASTISLISLAFTLNIWILILLFPFVLAIGYLIGFYLDKHNINSMDALKSNEMIHKFINTSDLKNQEFQMMQLQILLNALQLVLEGKEIPPEIIEKKYKEYLKKWKSPSLIPDTKS